MKLWGAEVSLYGGVWQDVQGPEHGREVHLSTQTQRLNLCWQKGKCGWVLACMVACVHARGVEGGGRFESIDSAVFMQIGR